MKRLHGHLAFGAATLALVLTAMVSAWRLHLAVRANAVIDEAARLAAEDPQRGLPPSAEGVPEAALARALAIAHSGDDAYELALHAFEAIAQTPDERLRRVVRYDLANLHLREALRTQDLELAKSKTFTELAKQNYRWVLEQEPGHWPARYNLERALWLAPEKDEPEVDTATPPPPQKPNGDKPDLP